MFQVFKNIPVLSFPVQYISQSKNLCVRPVDIINLPSGSGKLQPSLGVPDICNTHKELRHRHDWSCFRTFQRDAAERDAWFSMDNRNSTDQDVKVLLGVSGSPGWETKPKA